MIPLLFPGVLPVRELSHLPAPLCRLRGSLSRRARRGVEADQILKGDRQEGPGIILLEVLGGCQDKIVKGITTATASHYLKFYAGAPAYV